MVLVQGELQKRYIRVESQPVTTAGIYHSPSLGLISLSSDGTNRLTIADKNLGATQVYNDGDVLSEANCGKYFQWGNNYGFPFTGPTTTSSTKVNTTGYGPGNYYLSSTFIIYNGDRSSNENNNLWGDTTDTNVARQGPCPDGFHIPKFGEDNFYPIASSFNIALYKYLKIPFSGYIYGGTGTIESRGTYGGFYTASGEGVYSPEYTFYANSTYPGGSNSIKSDAYPIRPFKNTPVQPDDSWTVLYQ